MRKALVIVLAVLLILSGCRRAAPPLGGPPWRIVASIFPLADLAKNIGGNRVSVSCLLPPGRSPHGYRPTPEQAELIAESRLLVMNGLGMDEWARRAAKAAGRGLLVRLAEEVELVPVKVGADSAREHGSHEHEGYHASHGADPHIWLDPVLMIGMATAVGDALAKLDPDGSEFYRANVTVYANELKKLDEEYRRTLSACKHKEFVSFHSAYTYLAARYGLTQEAVFELPESDAARLEHVVEFVREHKVKVIFAEPQFPADRLKPLLKETGTILMRLDPLGNPNLQGHDTYLSLMRTNLAVLRDGLNME